MPKPKATATTSHRAVTLVPVLDGAAHLARASGELWTRLPYDATAPHGPLPCEWHTAASYGSTTDEWALAATWTTREARALLPHLDGAARKGRQPLPPASPDGALAAAAMATGRYPNRESLATALGVPRKALSRACAPVGKPGHYDLPAAARAALEAIVGKGTARKA